MLLRQSSVFCQKNLTLGYGAAEGLARQQAAQKLDGSVYDRFQIPQNEFMQHKSDLGDGDQNQWKVLISMWSMQSDNYVS